MSGSMSMLWTLPLTISRNFCLMSACLPLRCRQLPERRRTPSRQWHDLWLRIASTKVEGYLDGKLYLEYNLSGARWWTHRPCGRIGLWSKADSQMHLDDYTLTPAAMSPKDMQRAVLGPCVQGAA